LEVCGGGAAGRARPCPAPRLMVETLTQKVRFCRILSHQGTQLSVPCVSLGFPSPKVFKIGCWFVVPPALNPSGSVGPPAPLVPRLRWSPGSVGPTGVWVADRVSRGALGVPKGPTGGQSVLDIASGYSALRAVCFLGVSFPKSLQNLVLVCCPAGLGP
jgi:hypothetical protein